MIYIIYSSNFMFNYKEELIMIISKMLTEKDLNINYSIDFASLGGSFIGGIGDYVNLFEPNATKLEKEGFIFLSSGEPRKSVKIAGAIRA